MDMQTSQFNNKLDDLSSKLCGLFSEVGGLSSKLDTLNTNPSQHQQQTTAKPSHLQTYLNSTKSSLANQTTQLNKEVNGLCSKLETLAQHTATDLAHLQNVVNLTQYTHNVRFNQKLDSLSSKLDTLNRSLSQHQQESTAELAHIQTFLNSTNSKLDSLMATVVQLASGYQEIQANISDVQCMDTAQDNLTHQLETIKDYIENLAVHSCGGTGGWRRIVYLDMTDTHTTCPSGWNMTGYPKRTCGRSSTGWRTCSSATFPFSGGKYKRICGRIKAYQHGLIAGFVPYHHGLVTTIDGAYAECVSLTHGTPRKHIWTFAAGLAEGSPTESNPHWDSSCPCDGNRTIRIPPFVGNDYFCESGINALWFSNQPHHILQYNDILWDGKDCISSSTCCSQHNPPYFTKQLPNSTTDDIEARICNNYDFPSGNLAIELVELYVQ